MAEPGATEREVKLAAPAGFALPDLGGLGEAVVPVPLPTRQLDAVYYDTPDYRLARAGVTIRFRTGDGTGWTVKLPEGEDGPALVRRELPFPGSAGDPPSEAVDLVAAYARTAPLATVARLQTRREGVRLEDEEGHTLVEVVSDEVTVLNGTAAADFAGRFREVEVEVDRRAPSGLLDEVLARLRAAGAGAVESTPKLARALGDAAQTPPDPVVPTLRKSSSAAEVVRAAIASSVLRILRHDAGVRLGDDPEDVHQVRVATRRLRSDLRTFRALVPQDWADPLRDDLKWVGREVGAVRDADVLMERLRRQAGELPELDAAGFAPVIQRLSEEREAARTSMLVAMRSERYVALLDRLVLAAEAPELMPAAGKRARKVLPRIAARPFGKLRAEVAGLGREPSDAELHRVRILAKRARYAIEAVEAVCGKKAARLAGAVAEVQTVLGDQHDAVVAEEWLRQHTPKRAEQALVVGELVALQRAEAARGRRGWRRAWKHAGDKHLRKWLS